MAKQILDMIDAIFMALFGIPSSSEAVCLLALVFVAVLILAERIMAAYEKHLIAELLKMAEGGKAENAELHD